MGGKEAGKGEGGKGLGRRREGGGLSLCTKVRDHYNKQAQRLGKILMLSIKCSQKPMKNKYNNYV